MAKKEKFVKKSGSFGTIHIVTTPKVPGYKIKEVRGFVWASSVRAKFFLQDLKAMVRIFLGGEINEYYDLLNEARREILYKLNHNAKAMDANAVISVKLLATQIVPGTVEILAYGTAVKVEKKD